MSAPAPARRAPGASPAPIVGRDFAREGRGGRSLLRGAAPALLGAAVLVGLGVVALRNDLIRMRYALTAAMQEERDLLQQRRELTARVRALRDPVRLTRLAEARGFVRPDRVFETPSAGGQER